MDSKIVFKLRNEAKDLSGIEKLNKLNSALSSARNFYSEESFDEWGPKAFAWVLIDLCKQHIADKNINLAETCFNELKTIKFRGINDDGYLDQIEPDEIINKQINFLRQKIDINYSEVHRAEELSKNGKHQEALAIFKKLISEDKLTKPHHESYGWIIYRMLKAEENKLSSIEVRTFLRDYLNLKNERPSPLHSIVLNFALHYSKKNKDFNLYNFFKIWNPLNLRDEDKTKQWLYDKETPSSLLRAKELHMIATNQNPDEQKIPSLIARLCRAFIEGRYDIDIKYLIDNISIDNYDFIEGRTPKVLDLLREPFFWLLFNANKEKRHSDLWDLYNAYNKKYSTSGGSKWHSKILSLAERSMKEEDEWRFLDFFKLWCPENLRHDDWEEVIDGENTYKPLALKSIKKAFEIIKKQAHTEDLSWLINTYETGIIKFPNDEWILREKALLHLKNNELELAIKIYKQLALDLANMHYVWQEFSNCIVSNNSLKIGMLSKALSLQNEEDFLGDIHLKLAQILVTENLLENALVELELYKKHREIRGWKSSSLYDELYQKLSTVKQPLKDNKELYNKHIPLAEEFAYANIDWTEAVLVDKWKDKNGKNRLTFTDGKTIEFIIGANRFDFLRKSELGQVFKFKLHKQEINKKNESKTFRITRYIEPKYKYISLIVDDAEKESWSILKDSSAVVDYINKEKNIIHAITTINNEIFFPQIADELQIGDYITAKSYIKKVKGDSRTELRKVRKVEKEAIIEKFKSQIAIIDGVNDQKQLFHFVISADIQGIVKYKETKLRPNEGDFIKLSFATKIGKDKKLRIKVLDIEPSEEINPHLQKVITGLLNVKYKNYNFEAVIPDFAFIGDYYVPKYILEKNGIVTDCNVDAKAIYAGDKWKVVEVHQI